LLERGEHHSKGLHRYLFVCSQITGGFPLGDFVGSQFKI
jgi:hypothetical protein